MGLLDNLKEWIAGVGSIGIAGVIWMYIKKKGFALTIDKLSKKGTIVFREVGEFFFSLSDLSDKIDKSIKDNSDLIENNIKEVIKAGKVVKAELNDVIVIIKPKK